MFSRKEFVHQQLWEFPHLRTKLRSILESPQLIETNGESRWLIFLLMNGTFLLLIKRKRFLRLCAPLVHYSPEILSSIAGKNLPLIGRSLKAGILFAISAKLLVMRQRSRLRLGVQRILLERVWSFVWRQRNLHAKNVEGVVARCSSPKQSRVAVERFVVRLTKCSSGCPKLHGDLCVALCATPSTNRRFLSVAA